MTTNDREVFVVLISNEHGHVFIDSAYQCEDDAKEYRQQLFKKYKRDKWDAHSINIQKVDIQPKKVIK